MAKLQWFYQCCYLMLVLVLVLIGPENVGAMPCAIATSAAGSRVQCRHHRMTRFPAHVPDDVTWVDMSFNFLTSLDALNNPRLSKIQHLVVSHNSLTNLSNHDFTAMVNLQTFDLGHNALGTLHSDAFSGLTSLTTLGLSSTGLCFVSDTIFRSLTHLLSLDLSNNSLSSVPTTALQHVTSLQRLDLSRNTLTTIQNCSLHSLSNLQHLSLTYNHLTTLQPAAFDGLGKLVTLDLRFNQLGFAYPPDVFTPLASLENLELFGNTDREEGRYPMRVFDPLQSLKMLSLDTETEPYFGVAFRNLTSLVSLSFSPHDDRGCNIKKLKNNTFTGFYNSALQTLIIGECPLMTVDICAFCFLPHLTRLIAVGNKYLRVSSLLLALYGVQNQTLEEVTFSYSHLYSSTILDQTVMKYANNVCIKRLNMQFCGILAISSRAFDFHGRLLKCLRHVDLSWNAITNHNKRVFWTLSMALINIESLMMHTQMIFTIGNTIFRHTGAYTGSQRIDAVLYFNMASSMKYLNMSRGIRNLSSLPKYGHFPHSGNLTVLDMSYCGVIQCDAVITGLTNIQTLDFSGNNCYILGDWLFLHMPTLRRLILSNIFLQQQFLFTNGTRMLQPLGNLEELDISSNHLSELPADLLQHQVRLKRLILARNRLEAVPSAISQLTTLQDLDLSDNKIYTLSPSDQQILNSLAANHTFTLHLQGNPLSCACQALDMIRWLGLTTVRLDGENKNEGFDEDYDDNGRDYPCVLGDGSMSSTWLVITQWESHWRQCVGLSVFTVSVVAQMLQLLAILLTYVLWSNWTYVKHMWYVIRHVRLPNRADFHYHALLVYASDDLDLATGLKQKMLRVMPDLHVALPEDEILPGAFYSAELAECMGRSWKIILLVTQDFMEDDMSGYTVLHAQGCLSDTMPRRVLILYVGHLRPGHGENITQLSMRRLLRTLPESNMYHVTEDILRHPANPVWHSLAQAVMEE